MKERDISKKVQDLIDEFQTIPSDSLSLIVKNKVDVIELAKVELASRGLDYDGKWIGFDKRTLTAQVIFLNEQSKGE